VNLVQGERVLLQSSEGVLTLTTCRVRYESNMSGTSRVIGMTLDAVASCGLVRRSYPVLLVLAALAGVVGAVLSSQISGEAGIPLFVVAGVACLAYLLTRVAFIEVASSSGGHILVRAKGMTRDAMMEFIDRLEAAKLQVLDGSRRESGIIAAA
jgi:hypothetical protein